MTGGIGVEGEGDPLEAGPAGREFAQARASRNDRPVQVPARNVLEPVQENRGLLHVIPDRRQQFGQAQEQGYQEVESDELTEREAAIDTYIAPRKTNTAMTPSPIPVIAR